MCGGGGGLGCVQLIVFGICALSGTYKGFKVCLPVSVCLFVSGKLKQSVKDATQLFYISGKSSPRVFSVIVGSRSELTMLSRHSARTYEGNELARNSSGNSLPQSSQLAEPL